ncbi:MAG: hypothetical protein KJO26_03215 [Deltaproteobacteria bacterium]|nr:hypothetical protein [Deltaproteobacteria bacterium]
MKPKFYSRLWGIALFIPLLIQANAQEQLDETYTWDFDVNPNAKIVLANYDCDMQITTSETNKVQLELNLQAESISDEDMQTLVDFMDGLDFNASADRVELSTKIYRKMNSIHLGVASKIDVLLLNGEKVKLKKFKVKAALKLPDDARFEFQSKYSKIFMDNIMELTLNSYDDKIYGKDVLLPSKIQSKYSDLEFNNMNNITMSLYDDNFTAAKTGHLKIESKYTNFEIEEAGNIQIVGYDDNMNFVRTGNISLKTKYTKLSAEKAGTLLLDIYDSNIEISKITDLSISNSKYSKYIFNELNDVKVVKSYDDHFELGETNSLKVNESKYTKYIIDLLKVGARLTGYDDDLHIDRAETSFKYLDVDEKYGNIKISIPVQLALKIDSKTKYGKLNFEESDFETRVRIKDGSEQEYIGFRGSESEGMPYIIIRGYDVSLSLNQ